MATTARTKKEVVAGTVKPEEKVTIKTDKKVENQTTESVKEKHVFKDSEYILCQSVTYGGLNVSGQSGNLYEFKDYGATCEINYRDLIYLIRKGSDHVFLPRFLILNNDLLEEFPTIKRSYEKMYTKEDLLDILKLPIPSMRAAIKELPEASSEVLCKMIGTEISSGRLDSIIKVRALSEIYNSDFNLLSDLFVR